MSFSFAQKKTLLLFFLGQVAYLNAVIFLLLSYGDGLFRLEKWLFFATIGVYYLGQGWVLFLILTNRNQRFRDPSMTFPQILFALMVHFYFLYFMDEQIRGAMVFISGIGLLFGTLNISFRQSFFLAFFCIFAYLGVFVALLQFNPDQIDPRIEGLRILVFACFCFWIAIFSGYLKRLRTQLQQKSKTLALANKEMLETQNHLLDTAHQAGMAEIASEVLHNIGHTLNSLSVSAGLVQAKVGQMRTESFSRVAGLLGQQGDPARFFSTEDGGIALRIIGKLSQDFGESRRLTLEEIRNLQGFIEKIRTILANHRRYVGNFDLNMEFNVESLVEKVLASQSEVLQDLKIDVIKNFEDLPPLRVDRFKLRQVIQNLLKNALEALGKTAPLARRVLGISAREEVDGIRLEIWDSGPGIPKDKQHLVFSFGFTTKPDRLGFGLHYCANAIGEMGGKIALVPRGDHLEEGGPGMVFSIYLPCQRYTPAAKSARPTA